MPGSYARPRDPMELAARVAAELARVDGVVAVVLGGSLARGEDRPDSDLDLGIYYRARRPLSVDGLGRLAATLDERGAPGGPTQIGEWGPWINGGAWLQIDGRRVDWLYRELGHVADAIDRCRVGRLGSHYQAGHPHAFHEHSYLGEVHHAMVLHDPEAVMDGLRARTDPYPEPMRVAIVDRFLWEAAFSLETSRKSAGRADVAHVAGSLYRSVACLVQVLFALNRRYVLNEKGSVATAGAFRQAPPRFAETVAAVLSATSSEPDALQGAIDEASRLVQAVAALCRADGLAPAEPRP